ncbi:MAG TPA: GIY-YIG nuclease family protein [Devosiaceae bacterium]
MLYFVYVLASRPYGAIYIGATRDLRRRVEQHRARAVPGHTRRYQIETLVYFETHDTLEAALVREKRLKRWKREWKDQLIGANNPGWRDLSADIPFA